MDLTAFAGLINFWGKPRKWQILYSMNKVIKDRTSLKHGKYSDVSRKTVSWRRVEKYQTNKGD